MNTSFTPRVKNLNFSSRPMRKHHNSSRNKQPMGFSNFESEVLTVFNQVQKNRLQILKKDSSHAFYSKKTVKTLKLDENGNKIIEKYESTSFGGLTSDGKKLAEMVQQYSNTSTGLEKTSIERVLDNKLRKIEIKQKNNSEYIKDTKQNLDGDFDNEWKESARTIGARKIKTCESQIKSMSTMSNL